MELVLLGSRAFPLLQMRRHPNRSSGDACRIARGSRNVLGLHHYIRWNVTFRPKLAHHGSDVLCAPCGPQ
jgi:hypothetical protein